MILPSFYAIFNTSSLVKLALNHKFLVYLFLAFILKTLTFSSLNCSKTLNSTLEPSTNGVQIFVSLPSSSDKSITSTDNFSQIFLSNFFTSITSPFLTIN